MDTTSTPPLRDRPMAAAAVIIASAVACSVAVGLASLIAGFHGNAPVVWLYLTGPIAWACHFAQGDSSYLWTLGLSTLLVWLAYWSFLILGPSRLNGLHRAMMIFGLHFTFAVVYHITFGVP